MEKEKERGRTHPDSERIPSTRVVRAFANVQIQLSKIIQIDQQIIYVVPCRSGEKILHKYKPRIFARDTIPTYVRGLVEGIERG